jgi:general secretion pathway protein D
MVRAGRRLLAVLLLLGLGPGCASAYRQGRSEAEQGNWDLAVARFTKALQGDPNNIRTRLALENARVKASHLHYGEAKKHLAANELEAAADSLDIAVKYDPANRSAFDDLLIVRDRIRKREEERQHRAEFEAMKARAQAVRLPVAVLSPRSPVPVVIKYADASLEKILESLGKLAGVNILFDEGYRDKKYTVNLTGVTFQEALDQITFVNRLFYKVLDQNTLIIVPESRQKRNAYDDLMLRTFYLQNAEMTDTLNLIKTIAKIQTAAGNASLGAITVVGTLDQLAWAERIIESNDKARGEVMIEVQVLNVNRTKLKQYGLKLSNYGAGVAFKPSGNADEATSDGFTQVRAHLLSSFNLADFVVSVPTSIFAKFIQTDNNARILASPRLRAAEGKKATLKIGQEVPIPVTTFSTVSAGVGQSFAPATSFTYRNVGVTLDITPKVSASGDITLELAAEFSLLGGVTKVGNSGDLPTFLTRSVSGTLRLRDGETSLIGGLLQQSESDALSGVFGLQSIPILNKIFTDRTKSTEDSEILISITPHIVRGPKLTEQDMIPLGVGTTEVPKVEGARPGLFGPELAPALPARPAAPGAPKPSPGAGAAPSAARPAAPPESAAPVPPPTPLVPAPEASPSEVAEPPAGAGRAAASPAPATLLLSPPEASLKVGEKGGLGLVVVGARDVLSVEVVLTYDATLIELAEVGPGSLLTLDGQPVGAERTGEAGRARVRFTRTAGATGSGAIVSVTLKGLRAGSGVLGIESLALVRAGETERPTLPAPGRVIVNP